MVISFAMDTQPAQDSPPPSANIPAAPTLPARLLGAIPLFLLFGLTALVLRLLPHFEQMFKEMDLGRLPLITEALFAVGNFYSAFPFVFPALMFALAWVFFAWGCKKNQRMLWCAWVCAMLNLVLLGAALMAYFEPIIIIMERIGR